MPSKNLPLILSVFLGLTLVLAAFIIPQFLQNKNSTTTRLTSLNPTLATSDAGFNDIVINARGTNGKEKIALFINNQPVEFWNLTNRFRDYTYTPDNAVTVNELSIHFLNDTWEPENNINYDVQIPYITVNGGKFESQNAEVISTGSWDQDNWCAPGNKRTQWLHCNGSFTYDIPAGTVVGDAQENESVNVIGAVGSVKRIKSEFTVSQGHTNTQMETIDVKNGQVYIAYIEPGSQGDGGKPKVHNTVVAQGIYNGTEWSWTKRIIDRRTAYDVWHNAPSIAVDNDGYIHVAYNMHNLPWQYQVSQNPYDITSWEFKGQSITSDEFNRYYLENKTSFPTNGIAAIPGNQISYPAFFKDKNGDIYITYRFAAQPKRSFAQRMMSSGISRYDTVTKKWTGIGSEISTIAGVDFTSISGAPQKPTVFAGQEGWTSYFPQLAFDDTNAMHFTGVWRSGVAGAITGRPCYLKSQNQQSFTNASNQNVSLPLKPENCGNINGISNSQELNSITSFTVKPDGTPHYLVLVAGQGTRIYTYLDGSWSSESAPGGATEIFTDAYGDLYAIARDVKIYKQSRSGWDQIYDAGVCGYYHRVALNHDKSVAYIHTHGCDTKSSVYALQLR